MTTLAAIILTRNETVHLERCIASLGGVATELFVVDSYSEDDTVELARRLGARVFERKWVNYATQLNWALDTLPITSEWVMRIDADEYLEETTRRRLLSELGALPAEVTGAMLRRQVHFMGKWIRNGGLYPIWHLRVWRRGCARCEDRWMDEHMWVSRGGVAHLPLDFIDANLNSITWWTAKHNSYASREAIDMLNMKYQFSPAAGASQLEGATATKRRVKESVYSRLPLGMRALAYFVYRYIFRLGFLDGYQGVIFHSLQGLWYRALVDIKIYEVERLLRSSPTRIKDVIRDRFNISV